MLFPGQMLSCGASRLHRHCTQTGVWERHSPGSGGGPPIYSVEFVITPEHRSVPPSHLLLGRDTLEWPVAAGQKGLRSNISGKKKGTTFLPHSGFL